MKVEDLDLFVRTANTGNITSAAHQLDMTSATASAALKRLEKQLGAQLFIRSTRQLRITAEGERFLLHCQQALQNLEEGKASMYAMQGKIAGKIRLATSSDFGRNILLPWLDEVMLANPELALDLSLGDSLSDFYLDRVDMQLRYGEPEDSSLIAFPIVKMDRVICASPNYIAKFGRPKTPEDLIHHNCLCYQVAGTSFDTWTLKKDKQIHKIKVSGRHEANDADIIHRWAVAGKGIAYKSRLDMAEDLASGALVELMPDYQSPELHIYLICPSRKQVTPVVLMLRDFLRKKCAEALAPFNKN